MCWAGATTLAAPPDHPPHPPSLPTSPPRSGAIPKRKALPGVVYSVYDDAKKGQDAARIRSFIEVGGELFWLVLELLVLDFLSQSVHKRCSRCS